MPISAPIYALKHKAKRHAKQAGLRLHQALDKVAAQEGFQSWSHLAAGAQPNAQAAHALSQFDAGDMVLLAARPKQGKTLLGLEMAARAPLLERSGFFFTLEATEKDIAVYLSAIGLPAHQMQDQLSVDTSDAICGAYIAECIQRTGGLKVVVIDYLQLLDQNRERPNLEAQMTTLRAAVRAQGAICVVLSQVDRTFDLSDKTMPELTDIRLPNPLDLSVFDRVCFLHNGQVLMR